MAKTFYYLGNRFYFESGTIMGTMVTEHGQRAGLGDVSVALEYGHEVTVKQATPEMREAAEKRLKELKARRK